MSTEQKIYSFIDAIQNVTARDSFYNSKESKVEALKKLHNEIREIDSDLYKMFMFYPGINDYNRLNIIGNILSDKNMSKIDLPAVGSHVAHDSFNSVMRDMGYPRVMRFFLECRERKINNKRLKRTALEFVLNDEGIVNRTLQYRKKMKDVLEHVWGKRQSSALIELSKKWMKGSVPSKQQTFLNKELLKYRHDKVSATDFIEAVCFVFKADVTFRNPVFSAYEGAKIDLSKGFGKLPRRTLIGIRNNHHKDFDLAKVYEKTEQQQSTKDKITTVRASQKAGREVNVSADTFSTQKLDELYKYAYEMGLTDEVKKGIAKATEKVVSKFNLNLGKVALVIDNSPSMGGKVGSKNDPIAKGLAFAKFLEVSANECRRFYITEVENEELPELSGESCYAKALLQAAKTNPDIIFIIGDGYENAPEGLTSLTIKGLHNLGLAKNIVHINPVYAVESGEARTISEEVSTLPFNDLNKLEGSFMKVLLQRNPKEGVKFLKTYLFGYAYKHFGLQLTDGIKKQLEEQKKIDFDSLLGTKVEEVEAEVKLWL